jgi:hypothetical protein
MLELKHRRIRDFGSVANYFVNLIMVNHILKGTDIALVVCDRTGLNTIKGSKRPWLLLFLSLTYFAKVFGLGDFIEITFVIIKSDTVCS